MPKARTPAKQTAAARAAKSTPGPRLLRKEESRETCLIPSRVPNEAINEFAFKRDDAESQRIAEMSSGRQRKMKNVLPKSASGKACGYTFALWKRLKRFLDYPELELSNNLAENSMRPIATGRKNWIHIGSQQAGPRVAAILSVVESCRRLNIPVRDYLGDILPGLANTKMQRVAELTPEAWAARHTSTNP